MKLEQFGVRQLGSQKIACEKRILQYRRSSIKFVGSSLDFFKDFNTSLETQAHTNTNTRPQMLYKTASDTCIRLPKAAQCKAVIRCLQMEQM